MKKNIKRVYVYIILIVLLAVILSTTFTLAYFGRNRKFSGIIGFSGGIKIHYSNVEVNENAKIFKIMKLGTEKSIKDFSSYSDLTPLNEIKENVRSEEVFYLANPYLTPEDSSVDYFLRMKVNFETKDEYGQRLMTTKEIENVFGNSFPLQILAPTQDSVGWVQGYDDNFYLVKAGQTVVANYSSLYVNSGSVKQSVNLFTSDGNQAGVNYSKLHLSKVVDQYLVSNFIISISIEAIDARPSSGAVESNIWNL